MTSTPQFLGIMHKLGTEGKTVSKVYRRMLDLDLFIAAYTELATNQGRLTPGTDGETIDGTSLTKLQALLDDLRNKTFKWTPVRRSYIPKSNGKVRPLGISSWQDKVVQMVLKMVLESYYEPIFNDRSHGFRPNRGCHTALLHVRKFWQGTKWFIEGDIEGCFDNIPHAKILELLERRIKDNQVIRLIKDMLKAGYLEQGIHYETHSGTPQGGIVSPLLSNIVLHELDNYVTQTLIPQFNKGKTRRRTKEYTNTSARRYLAEKRGDIAKAKLERKQLRYTQHSDDMDPNYRRLDYVRYADDFILSCIGSKQEAEEVKARIAGFIEEELGLKLNLTKTLVTNAKHERARFLGYEIGVIYGDKMVRQKLVTGRITKRHSVNGQVQLYVPKDVRDQWVRKYQKNGKATHRNRFLSYSDFEIIKAYGSEWLGLVGYYSLAANIQSLRLVEWNALQSCQKTLAGKHKTTTSKIREQYEAQVNGKRCLMCEVKNPNNPQQPLRAIMGGIPLRTKRNIDIGAYDRIVWNPKYGKVELTRRLLADRCEVCGSTNRVQVHHIKSIRELKRRYRNRKDAPSWVMIMSERYRNTLVVCHDCHWEIHRGNHDGPKLV
jgi:group II intron reverse transcriptase/maturase